MLKYTMATTDNDYAEAARLFKEYAAWLNIDLSFQHFDEELMQLKSMYTMPNGGIILCKNEEAFVACVGIRKFDDTTAEMKRMYVNPKVRGKGIAAELVKRSITLAGACGYTSIVLDTLNTMTPAMNLYKKFGFEEIPAYYHNPNPTVVYFKKSI